MRKDSKEENKMSLPLEKLEQGPRFPKEISRSKLDLPISYRLRKVREARGFTLKKVVQLLKIEVGVKTAISTIQGYEMDEDSHNHRYPSIHMLLPLAKVYGCSVDYLLGITDEVNIQTNDIHDILQDKPVLLWQGKEILDEERGIIIKKIGQIMAL